ncbi:MAG TPA: S53 family peptidase [Kofleriaceae bacterium]
MTFATRSMFTVAASALALASCVSSELDQQASELDGTSQELHAAVCSGGRISCKSRVRVDAQQRIQSSAAPLGLGPADLASAYNLNPATTSTATIAIVDAFHYPDAESDLAAYRSQFGLPPCTVRSGCLTILNQDGARRPLPGLPPLGDNWNIEAALDLDMASAACPTCKLVLFEAQDDQGDGVFIAQNAAAALPGVVAISDSWGEPSPGNDVAMDAQFFTHTQPVNVFVSSGDGGNTGSTPGYPSTSAHVIAVGGTHLVRSSTARGWTETAWAGSGSSCSTLIAKPSFQSAVPRAACTERAAADISAVGDPATGVAAFNAGMGGFFVVGGTSASSPLVAGIFARYGISGASRDASFPYAHPAAFFDITSGTNGTCKTAMCQARKGWDGPTGIGSPNGAVLGY